MDYNYFNPTRLITGENCVRNNSGLLGNLGRRCTIVTGKNSARKSGALDDVVAALKQQGIEFQLYDEVAPNPLLVECHKAAVSAREFGSEFVIGIGGGSPLDAAKAVAVFAANEMADPKEIFKNQWPNPALPIVAVGTTAGTGSEVGPYAVMTTPENLKMSFFQVPQTYPVIAFGDPKYTYSLPIGFTISTGLDALSHTLEGYFNKRANQMSDLFAREAAKILYPALQALEGVADGKDVPHPVREQLYYGSILAGYVLACCGTLLCHKLGYFLTEDYGVAHGTACAATLPYFMDRNQRIVPEKSAAIYAAAGCTQEEMSGLIVRLNDFQPVKVDKAYLAQVVERGVGTGNFTNCLSGGLSKEEALELMYSLYAK